MQPTNTEEFETKDPVYQFAGPAEWGRPRQAVCFAARISGLYVTGDWGKTWRSAYQTLSLTGPLPTLSVAVSSNPDQAPDVFAGYNGGLLRSLDGGHTWENITFPAPAPAVVTLAAAPAAQETLLFAGTHEDGVLYSSDHGAHWKTGNLGLIDMNVLCLGISPDFAAEPVIFAGTQSGLFVSRNAGRSWQAVDLPVGYEAVISLALSPHFAEDDTLLAGTETRGLLCSQDRGAHWHSLGQPVLSNAVDQILLSPDYPREPRLLVLHDGALFVSDDVGAVWKRWYEPSLENEAATAVLAPRGIGTGAPLWLGLEDGQTMRMQV